MCVPLVVTGIRLNCFSLAGGGSKAESLPPTKTLSKPW